MEKTMLNEWSGEMRELGEENGDMEILGDR